MAKISVELPHEEIDGGFLAGKVLPGKIKVEFAEPALIHSLTLRCYMVEKVAFPMTEAEDGAIDKYKKGSTTHFEVTVQLVKAKQANAGENSYDFTVAIPKDAPSTHEYQYGSIKAFIEAKLDLGPNTLPQTEQVEINITEFIPPEILQKWPQETTHLEHKFSLGGTARIDVTVPTALLCLGGKVPLLLNVSSPKRVAKLTMNLVQRVVYISDRGEKREFVDMLYHGTGRPADGMEKSMRAAITCPDEEVYASRSDKGLSGELAAAIDRSKGFNPSDTFIGPKMLVCVQHYVEFKLDFGLLTKEVHLTIPITFISPAQHAVAESMLNPSKDSNASSSAAAGASPAKTSSDAKPYQSPATPRRMKSVQNLAAALGGGELLIDLSDGPATSSAPAVTTAATSTIPSSSTSSSSSFSPMLQQAKAHSISPVIQAQPYMQQAQPLPQPMFTRSGSSSTLIRGFSSHHGLVYVPSPQHGQPQPQPQPIWDPFASPVPATQPIQPQQPQQPQQLQQQQQQPMMMVRRQPSVGGGLIPSPSPPMATQPAPQGMAPLLRSPSTNWAQW